MTGENRSTREKTCLSTTSLTTNPIRPGLVSCKYVFYKHVLTSQGANFDSITKINQLIPSYKRMLTA
jgi:hypothetical protein